MAPLYERNSGNEARCGRVLSAVIADFFHIALAETLDLDRFVTADRRQADAARAMGLAVDWVG